MAIAPRTTQRCKPSRSTALGGLSSVLRLAARGRRVSAASPTWLAGLTRAVRAAGSAAAGQPLRALPCGREFAPSEWLIAR